MSGMRAIASVMTDPRLISPSSLKVDALILVNISLRMLAPFWTVCNNTSGSISLHSISFGGNFAANCSSFWTSSTTAPSSRLNMRSAESSRLGFREWQPERFRRTIKMHFVTISQIQRTANSTIRVECSFQRFLDLYNFIGSALVPFQWT